MTTPGLRVWKYDVPVGDEVYVVMPYGAKLLHVASQHGTPDLLQLWALVEPTASPVQRRILIRGTGHPISPKDASVNVGTVIAADGALVWHVFDGGQIIPAAGDSLVGRSFHDTSHPGEPDFTVTNWDPEEPEVIDLDNGQWYELDGPLGFLSKLATGVITETTPNP